MFKVPEWGTDVPDTKVNFGKTSQKNKHKNSTIKESYESPINEVKSTDKKQHAKKSTNKRKLKKNRQKNRQLYQKLSGSYNHDNDVSANESTPGRFILNPNKVDPIVNQPQRQLKSNQPKKQIIKNKNTFNIPKKTNDIDVVKKPDPPAKQPDKKIKSKKHKNQKTFVPNVVPSETKNINGVKKAVKRKHDNEFDNVELGNIDTDKIDEIILNNKKKRSNDAFKDEDREDVLFGEKDDEVFDVKNIKLNKVLKNGDANNALVNKPFEKITKVDRKKELIRKVLQGQNGNRNSVNMSGNSQSLRERMLSKLQAAQFRYLNEKLYTSTGSEAKQLFQADPSAFDTYHQGYQQQIKKWPVNPLDVIVKRIMKMPRTHLVADMGCGSATLSQRVPHRTRSFDLVAAAPGVEPCDMARTPLLSGSVDAAVYCLALMGTELAVYLAEGNRVLKRGGHLLIAEVESRFEKLEDFTHGVERLGFKLVKADQSHQVFYFLEFKKMQEAPKKARHLALTLKPCLYKRR